MAENDKKLLKQNEDEAAVLKAIADMPEPDRSIGERLHKIIKDSAPTLLPRTWYGMPAYSNGNKVICYFRSKKKFGERYMTFGFNDGAKVDEGMMWPICWAIMDLNPDEEKRVAELMKKAVS